MFVIERYNAAENYSQLKNRPVYITAAQKRAQNMLSNADSDKKTGVRANFLR